MSLEPRIKFKNGARVEIALAGNINNIVCGKIIGLASEHLVDMWIILLDGIIIKDYPYEAMVCQHTFIRLVGDNKPFLCERVLEND